MSKKVGEYCACDDSYCRDCMKPRRTKDKTIQRAIVTLYLRLRRARHRHNYAYSAPTIPEELRTAATAEYIEAHNALEVMKRVLWCEEHPFVGREAWFLGGSSKPATPARAEAAISPLESGETQRER